MKQDTIQSAVKTLDYCVNLVLSARDEVATTHYQRFLQFAIKGYHALNIYLMPQLKTTFLEIDQSTLTAELPEDFIHHTAIGLCIGGRIWTLTADKALCIIKKDCPSDIQQAIINPNPEGVYGYGYYFGAVYRGSQYVGEQYGISGGWNRNGYYRIDETNRMIHFSSIVPSSEIILEYKSTGFSCDGSVSIPLPAVEPIEAFIHWQIAEHDKRISLAERRDKRQQYYVAYDKYKFWVNRATKSERRDAKFASIYSTIKR